jgi:hypothetical protein
MGGMNEKVIESRVETRMPAGKGSKPITIRKTRIHENEGEVHFHDDESKLKVAVPSGKFWAAWSTNVGLRDLRFHDTKRGTAAVLHFTQAPVEVTIDVQKSNIGQSFKLLNDFAMGK